MPLSPQRARLYDSLQATIGNTPLRRLDRIELPNGCKFYYKCEFENPTGSHYDREMVRLLRHHEECGQIIPRHSIMVESTTGNSGASFAWLCRVLDFPPPIIFIPSDMPAGRIAQVASFGADIRLTRSGNYITGLKTSLAKFEIKVNNHNLLEDQSSQEWAGRLRFISHWNDELHCVEAMRDLGREILRDAQSQNIEIDHMVLALGNGGSGRGISEVMAAEDPDIRIVGVEPAESPAAASELVRLNGEARWVHALDRIPQTIRNAGPKHVMYGTGPHNRSEIFPNLLEAFQYINDIRHPTSGDVFEANRALADREFVHVGHSSAGVLWAASEIAREAKRPQTIVGIFYDPYSKYLGWDCPEDVSPRRAYELKYEPNEDRC